MLERSAAAALRALALPSQLERSQPAARRFDLGVLALVARRSALVVAAQQQHDPLTIGVAEDPQQHRSGLASTRLARLAADHALVVANAELEQTLAEVLAMLGRAHVLTHIRQVGFDRGDRRGALRALQRAQPLSRRLAPLVILEELDRPPHRPRQSSSPRRRR